MTSSAITFLNNLYLEATGFNPILQDTNLFLSQ